MPIPPFRDEKVSVVQGAAVNSAPAVLLTIIVAAVVSAGCSHQAKFVPARAAKAIVGAESAAVSTVDGVRCSASAGSWPGLPRDLESDLRPMKVRFTNHSGQPIQILYQQFALVSPTGERYRPLPVVSPSQSPGDVPHLSPVYSSEGFFVAPRLKHVYANLRPWSQPLDRDDAFYKSSFEDWPKELPTRDMARRGLPEGVLEDGGTISGYLYFPSGANQEDRVTFSAHVPNSRGDTVASIQIPFVVE